MKALSGLKGGRIIRLVRLQHGENDACPHIGQGAYSDGMAFALSSLALVVVPGPAFLLGRLPGKLVQGIAQRFDAAQPPVRLGVVATLKQDRRGPGQSLQTPCIRIAGALITDLGEQQGVCLLWAESSRPRCLHASKKGGEFPSHTGRSVQPAAAVARPEPASGAIWCGSSSHWRSTAAD